MWKIVILRAVEKDIIMDYHVRYGHMGALKVVKALQEHVYIKDANRKVRNHIKHCHICQLVNVNNDKKEGTMMPITSSSKLEKVFVDICGPFPRSGGRHQYKYFVIMLDHYTRFTKLYPINRATTQKILNIIFQEYICEAGTPKSIITDHGTQFKGIRCRGHSAREWDKDV